MQFRTDQKSIVLDIQILLAVSKMYKGCPNYSILVCAEISKLWLHHNYHSITLSPRSIFVWVWRFIFVWLLHFQVQRDGWFAFEVDLLCLEACLFLGRSKSTIHIKFFVFFNETTYLLIANVSWSFLLVNFLTGKWGPRGKHTLGS